MAAFSRYGSVFSRWGGGGEPSRAGWFTAGSADYYDLGLIKGNLGNQVYQIPADVDLSKYRSVDLWCAQFSVSFGAAELAP
ncbi:DM13 domain-containing protein [Pseudarthrobacter sp. AL07]|uniref:DM13 domain-containing protein n=1 Tax=unclassified Pseudarthrobacter TaxID=2647000 RepID=UPI00249C2083|nr:MULTISPECIES: DM13 domain-containing protein [unclassified Pseudarthrobacter]MDI3193972.1 DM13 domain-containing protein [Pseudarthrobacter sp. AL20]MDI3208067.1 DM13 domain-containing protein [Pseudarthrobacter sp. AL07]